MVFSSVPVYLDPPNWHQQHNHQQGTSGSGNPQLLPPLNPPTHVGAAGGGGGSIRPGSMADRARLAKIPQPEAALKCPRCESTNTKFCYFNNYSLSQPRHFCKTCRRYWTLGGALRNVPVGGGCRRNKKNKSSSSKSAASAEKQAINSNSTNAVVPSEIAGHFPQQTTPHLPFMASLQNFSQFGLGNIGLNFSGVQGQVGATTTGGASGQADMAMGFQPGTYSGMSSLILSAGGNHHQPQQFPFFEPTNGLYPFQSEGSKRSSSRVSQVAPEKMENNQGLNLSRSLMGVSANNQYYCGGNSWTDLSGLNASSTNHQL